MLNISNDDDDGGGGGEAVKDWLPVPVCREKRKHTHSSRTCKSKKHWPETDQPTDRLKHGNESKHKHELENQTENKSKRYFIMKLDQNWWLIQESGRNQSIWVSFEFHRNKANNDIFQSTKKNKFDCVGLQMMNRKWIWFHQNGNRLPPIPSGIFRR